MYQLVALLNQIDQITKQTKERIFWIYINKINTSCNHVVSPHIALINSVASAVGFNACNSAT